jgi:hypothetical protein
MRRSIFSGLMAICSGLIAIVQILYLFPPIVAIVATVGIAPFFPTCPINPLTLRKVKFGARGETSDPDARQTVEGGQYPALEDCCEMTVCVNM